MEQTPDFNKIVQAMRTPRHRHQLYAVEWYMIDGRACIIQREARAGERTNYGASGGVQVFTKESDAKAKAAELDRANRERPANGVYGPCSVCGRETDGHLAERAPDGRIVFGARCCYKCKVGRV